MRTLKGHMGSVTFDGATVTIEKKMRGQVRVPVGNIASVSIERAGIGMKGIRFAVAGGTGPHQSVALGSHKDLASDPYALTFRSKHEADFAAFADEVQAAR